MHVHNLLKKLYDAAVGAVEPGAAVRAHSNHILSTHAHYGFKSTIMLSAGKAAASMAEALLSTTGGIIEKGLVITGPGGLGVHDFSEHKNIEVMEADHPLPLEHSLEAGSRALKMVEESSAEDTLLVCLISGGASSLLSAPADGILPEEKREVIEALMKAGADILELNTVRKHLSDLKGGRLTEAAYPSMVLSLIVSDVPGDDMGVIASGPTAPDKTTASDALAVLDRYSVSPPATVLAHLLAEQRGLKPGTPDEGEPIFERTENIVVLNNRTALEGALNQAHAFSLNAEIIGETLTGDVAQASLILAAKAAEQLKSGNLPVCLISGGETTVNVTGKGTGGRNMELALRFALELDDLSGITMLSAGTDGIDGPTDAAGALVDPSTVPEARQIGLDAARYVEENDSYTFFQKAGGLFITGPTGTNVMDVQLIIIGA